MPLARPHTASTAAPSFPGRLLKPDRVVAPPGGEIASILVQARPDRLAEVEAAIVALAGCEIHGRDPKGKLVVVVEAPDAGATRRPRSTPSRCCRTSILGLARLPRHRCRPPDIGRIVMTEPKLDRRQVLKLEAAAMAAPAGGMPAPALAANLVTERAASELKWDKAPCRFCGTGCSVMVATKDNRVVATHGDIKSEVNRGLNCVKGYFLSKIMYGHDRLTQPMLRKTNGKYDKNGEFTPVSWDEAFDDHGGEVQGRAEEARAERRRHVRLRPVDDLGRLRGAEAVQGRLPLQQHRPQRAPLHGVRRRRASCAPSASTSRWAATTTSRPPTRSCCGARTWPRCTRSCGRG